MATTALLVVNIWTLAADAASLTYTDKLGRTVHVEVPVRRAIPLQLYEFLPALRCWDRIVGIARYAHSDATIRAAMPDISKRIPAAGGGNDLNIEALLTLKPDLVITWAVNPDQVRFMEQKGLRVIAVSPESLPDVYGLLELQGRIYGCAHEARQTKRHMQDMLSLVRRRSGQIPVERRSRVLFVSQRPTTVAGSKGMNHDLIELAGGRNVAADIHQKIADVSMETIVAWNPDVVFIWGFSQFGVKDLLANPQWRHIKAVREDRVYKAPKWSTWSPSVAPVALWMAMKTYPELYRDTNLHAVTEAFYRSVYGIPMVKEDLNDF